ncbi:MAG: electron transport complex subunit RsxC [Oscillospiraceae bacterium]|jgi:electron transport complex protein RnfC|nr:electron transport complex subunit RsxC [Oscillospiraceae bacterium]
MSAKIAEGVLGAVGKYRGGVGVKHFKNTAEMEVERLPEPKRVVISMQHHIGAPCAPLVKPGGKVSVGQPIGDSPAYVSTPIHASVSGEVSAVGELMLPNGRIVQAVTIESDGEMRQFEEIAPPRLETKEDFIKAIRASGLVGLGGAGFPTHVKFNIPEGKKVDTLVINAAECEPFITVDYRECIDNSWDILSAIELIKRFLNIDRAVIVVEDNKPEAIKTLARVAANMSLRFHDVSVMSLKSRYPQGAEKMAVYSATGRIVPAGKLPMDAGCLVINVASAAFIARYVKSGKPLVSRSLTVDGSAIANRKNVRAPIGTQISDLIDFCGGFVARPGKIMFGGPMMGLAVTDANFAVLKNNNAVLAFLPEKEIPESACIHCGRCAAACPMSLSPTLIERCVKIRDIDALKKTSVDACMECGSCAYSCPARKPLVQTMRLAKSLVHEVKKL